MFKRRTTLGETARYICLVGGLFMFVSLFFSWSDAGSAFETFQQDQVWLLTLSVVTITLAILDMFIDWGGFLPLAGMIAMLDFGGPFFFRLEFQLGQSGAGWYVNLLGAAMAGAAGIIAIVDLVIRAHVRGATPAASPGHRVESPPGWYPDPSGQHRQRYWSGVAWTADVQ